LSILFGKDSHLVLKIGNDGFSVSKSSLEAVNFNSEGIKLGSEIIDGSRELGVLVG
jgi:hypothetical protein